MEPDSQRTTTGERGASRLLANTVYRAVAEAGSKLASVALYVVMARELGEAGFGVFTIGLAAAVLVTALAGFGQDHIMTREVARDHERIHGFFFNTLSLKLVLAVPALGLALAAGTLVGIRGETWLVIAIIGVALIAEQLTSSCFGVFQAFERMAFIPVVLIAQRTATAAVGIAALLLGADVVAVSAVYLAGSLLALGLAVGLVFGRVARPRFEIERRRWWPLMRVAFPVGLSVVFGTILFRIDAAILAAFESDAVVGEYGAAFRLFEATLFLSWSVGTASYPVFARLTRETVPAVGEVLDRSLKLVTAATLPLAVGAAVLGEEVVTLVYGEDFAEAGTALALLAPAIALYPAAHVVGGMLVAQNRQVAVALVYAAVAVQNVVGNLILIPLFSLEGAALETSITQALLAVSFLWLAARSAGAHDWRRIAGGPALAAAAAAVVLLLLRSDPWTAVGAATAVYLLALALFERSAFPEDARAVTDFVRRRPAGQT